jgi:acylphosphatase
MIGRQLRIYGRVQGVGFRYALHGEALRLELRGWVRNRADGSVEALLLGAAGAVEELVEWSHRGPPSAHVQRVVIEELGPQEIDGWVECDAFEQRPTA